jgi:hypothetical protein
LNVIKKMATAPLTINVFGSALVNNQCCLYDPGTTQKKEVGSFSGDTAANTNTLPPTSLWSTRNIVVLSLVALALAFSVWAVFKYAVLVKKQKNLQ